MIDAIRPRFRLMTALALAAGLSACGGDRPPASPEIVHAIKARKENYKEIGGAFKTITDEIKIGSPDANSVGSAAREVQMRSKEQLQYFVPGSGPDSGEKTRAKAEIWADLPAFRQKHEDFIAAADKLVATVNSGDVAAMVEQHKAVGAACKTCHDRFRAPDE